MAFFAPDYQVKRVYQITPHMLAEMGITALILDIDNTLTTHDNPVPDPLVAEWLEQMKNHGIGLIVVSNNHAERVGPFAEILGLGFIANGKKPLASGLKRAQQVLGVPKKQIAVVGDQIFTDILGGNLYGVTTILVEPIELEDKHFFRFKRRMEKIVVKREDV